MLKNISNLGTTLNKSEQQTINGGKFINCYSNPICPPYREVACIVRGNICTYLP